jgi:hypothetical protein
VTLIEQAITEGVITEEEARLHEYSLEGMVLVAAVGETAFAIGAFGTLARFLAWLEHQKITGHTLQ